MAPAPDPIAAAAAYQRLLVSLLGDDDPIDVQAATPAKLHALLKDAGPELHRRPAPKEWSVLELLGHMVDAEMVMAARYRWTISQDKPPLPGYDQDLWVDRLHHNEDEPDALLETFTALRGANVGLWQRSSAADRERVALHAERGPESYDLMFRMLAGHDRVHLAQAHRAIEAARATGR